MNVIHHSASSYEDLSDTKVVRDYFGWIIRIGVGSIFLLGVLYLILSNALAMRGFTLEELKAESLSLHKELEEVDIAIAMTTSLYAIQSSEQVQEMPYATKKHFVTVEKQNMAFLDNKEELAAVNNY